MKPTRLNIVSAVLVGVLVAVLVPFQAAHADLGPKPYMGFEFIFEIDPAPTVLSGTQYECDLEDCSDAEPLERLGAQGFDCYEGKCSSTGYDYADYHYLSLEFSDGVTRQSNIFEKKYFEAYYQVTVQEDGLLVKELTGKKKGLSGLAGLLFVYYAMALCMALILYLPLLVILIILLLRDADFNAARGWYIAGWVNCLLVLIPAIIVDAGIFLTLVVELLLALAYALWRKRPHLKLLTVVAMMNLITQPLLWLAVQSLGNDAYTLWLGVGEGIVWLVEAGILAVAMRKQAKFLEALALSLVLNLASFGIGLLLPF